MTTFIIYLAWHVLVFIKIIMNLCDLLKNRMTVNKLLIVDAKPVLCGYLLTFVFYLTPILIALQDSLKY